MPSTDPTLPVEPTVTVPSLSDWAGTWSSLESSVRPATVDKTDWNNVWTDFVGLVGTTDSSVSSALNAAAAELNAVGQPTTNVNTLEAFELFQATGATRTDQLLRDGIRFQH